MGDSAYAGVVAAATPNDMMQTSGRSAGDNGADAASPMVRQRPDSGPVTAGLGSGATLSAGYGAP